MRPGRRNRIARASRADEAFAASHSAPLRPVPGTPRNARHCGRQTLRKSYSSTAFRRAALGEAGGALRSARVVRTRSTRAAWSKNGKQPAVHPVRDDLAHRRRVGGDDPALERHRLDQRPGQDERIGQVEVRRGDLQHAHELLVGHPPDEMDPRPVDRASRSGAEDLEPRLRPSGGRADSWHRSRR